MNILKLSFLAIGAIACAYSEQDLAVESKCKHSCEYIRNTLSIKEQIHEKEQEHHHSSGFSVSTKPISDTLSLYKGVDKAITLHELRQIKAEVELQKQAYEQRVILEAPENLQKDLVSKGVSKEEAKEQKEEFKEALKDRRVQKAVLDIQKASRLLRRDASMEAFEPSFNLGDYKDAFDSKSVAEQEVPDPTSKQKALSLLSDAMEGVQEFAQENPRFTQAAGMLLDAGSQVLRAAVYTTAVSSGFIAGGPVGAVGAFIFVNAQEEVVAKGFEALCEKGIEWAKDQGRTSKESKRFVESLKTFGGLCGAYLTVKGVKGCLKGMKTGSSLNSKETFEYKKPIREMSDREFVQSLADRADKRYEGMGPRVGTKKHEYAEVLGKRYQELTGERKDLQFEQRYKWGREYEKEMGLKDSVIPDVFNKPKGEAFDYKFGNATLGEKQIQKLETQLPKGEQTKTLTITEIKPTK